ncbi:MAG: ABC transporter substrate-binding protein [Desulfomonile tiedjei]|nr:ABC transporter substrate-binding protein [Desulfomonile tiedjei]
MKFTKAGIIGAIVLIGLLLLATVVSLLKSDTNHRLASATVDLSRHLVYASYHFEKDDKIIHIGVQPLWIFEGNVAEIMKRDNLLQERLARLGLEIRLHSFLKGDDINFFIRRGDLHGGMLGDMPTLTLAAEADVVIPALVDRGFNSIVAAGFVLVRDLKGLRIGYPFGSFSHHALLEALSADGLTERHVDLRPMDVTEIPEAFRKGEIQVFAAWEPAVSIARKKNPKGVVIHRSRYLGFMVFRKNLLDNHPDAVREILASEIRALRWIQHDGHNLNQSSEWALEAGKVLTGGGMEISAEQSDQIIAQGNDMNLVPLIPAGALQDNGHLHREFTFLKNLGRIAKTSAWDVVVRKFDRDLTAEVLAQPGKYRLDEFDYDTGRRR